MDWVLCSERLPDKDGTYVVTTETVSGRRYVDNVTFGAKERAWVVWTAKVIAWLPVAAYSGPA